jgi:hypothetical protein
VLAIFVVSSHAVEHGEMISGIRSTIVMYGISVNDTISKGRKMTTFFLNACLKVIEAYKHADSNVMMG